MDIRSIHIAKIVGLSKYESELEARLELVLHNMRIYGVSNDKRQRVIDELNKRHNINTNK